MMDTAFKQLRYERHVRDGSICLCPSDRWSADCLSTGVMTAHFREVGNKQAVTVYKDALERAAINGDRSPANC